jgi:hypothetical protein
MLATITNGGSLETTTLCCARSLGFELGLCLLVGLNLGHKGIHIRSRNNLEFSFRGVSAKKGGKIIQSKATSKG